jgi:hypothetical protein
VATAASQGGATPDQSPTWTVMAAAGAAGAAGQPGAPGAPGTQGPQGPQWLQGSQGPKVRKGLPVPEDLPAYTPYPFRPRQYLMPAKAAR